MSGNLKQPLLSGNAEISEAELAKHTSKEDAWISINGDVINVVNWFERHPGGEQVLLMNAGKDASVEWNMIHPKGTMERNLVEEGGNGPWLVGRMEGAGAGPLTMEEVAKHTQPGNVWIVINGEVLDVTNWIPNHPGGEQAIMQYAGKDASTEWNMIHQPGTVEKNLNFVVKKGKLAGAETEAADGPVDDTPPPPEGNGGIPGVVGALVFMLINLLKMVLKSVFFTHNFVFVVNGRPGLKFTNNRLGTARSACFLITFIIVHALGNFVDMLGGPNELNGEGYLFDRIHWTGAFGLARSFPLSVVEEYLALALLLHVSVALKRSYDMTISQPILGGRWNMLLSGLVTLFFLAMHLQDFRFYSGYEMVDLRVPRNMISFSGLKEGRIFYEVDKSIEPVKVRDIYSHEVELFKDLGRVLLYTACICTFVVHLCLGWKKLVPADAMQIPKDHVRAVTWLGWLATAAVAGMYLSVPWYVYLMPAQKVVSA